MLAEIRTQFPEYAIDVIDVAEIVKARRWSYLLAHAAAAGEYGPGLLTGARPLRTFRWRTSYMIDLVQRVVRQELGDLSRYACTFQTQSLFDGSMPGVPHFVYTDHALLTNLQYPDTDATREFYSQAWMRREPEIYHHASTIFTMSSHVTRSLVDDYAVARDRIAQVGVGCHAIDGTAEAALPPRSLESYAAKRILFVGTLWELKGGPELVSAFARVRRAVPDAELSIIGVSPAIAQAGVTVHGRLPLAALAEHYRNATVFCMPSKRDAFGIVFLEAFAHRLPVVALNIGAAPDLVTPGVNGELTAPGDADALVQALTTLASNPALCKAMGDRAYDVVMPRYTWEYVGKAIADRMRVVMS